MTSNTDLHIELYVLCFNEAKMIRHTLNYYSKFCSKITVIDNQSTDQSIQFARRFKKVEIKTLDSGNEFIEDVLTESRNNCWKGSTADYVIVCDMDEFLYDDHLIEKLQIAKEKHIAMPMITGYNMMHPEFPTNYHKLITEQVKQGVKSCRFDKNIIFDPKRIKEINYRPGAHICYPEFYEGIIVEPLIELKLLHFKYLGRDYLYQKHKGYVHRMSDISREKRHGYEYLDGNDHVDQVFDSSNHLTQIIN